MSEEKTLYWENEIWRDPEGIGKMEKSGREETEGEKSENEKAKREKAEREKSEREKFEREKTEGEKAEREKTEWEETEMEKAGRAEAAGETGIGKEGPGEVKAVVAEAAAAASSTEREPAAAKPREIRKMREHFGFFGPATVLYALFYAFCMYKNGSGITFPFFLAGSIFYFGSSMKKLGLTLKKGSGFYMAVMMLLAISTFCTDDGRIIALNKTGIFLLMVSFLLKQFLQTERWRLGKYFSAIMTLLFYSIGELPEVVIDAAEYFKKRKGRGGRKAVYVFLGLLIAAPIFLVVLALLSSADAVFRQWTVRLFSELYFSNLFGILARVVLWYFGVYMIVSALCGKVVRDEVRDRRNGEPLLAITVTGMLSLLYLIFSGIQIVYLFLGNMSLPAGYTYAEYAREGFFQLLTVSVINLVIVLFCMAFFRENAVLKGILTVMSFCTFIMIASSALRMIIYIRYYYLTFLRILVLWSLVVLFLLFTGVVISIYRERFPLFRYGMTVVSILYLALSFAHPDYWIARVNIANAPQSMAEAKASWEGLGQWEVSGEDFFQASDPYHDYRYLSKLSADAAPALIPYMERLGFDFRVFEGAPGGSEDIESSRDYWDALERYTGRQTTGQGRPEGFGYYYLQYLCECREDMSLRSFNVSRYMACRMAETR